MRKQIIIAILFLFAIGIYYNWNSAQMPIKESIDAIPGYIDDHERQRIMMRGGEIAPHKMLAARKIVMQKTEKLLATYNQKDGGIRGWSTIGPCNIGGRVRAIALQPNGKNGENIFAGAAGGGLWISKDDGVSYEVHKDIDLSLAITSISIDPVNPNRIYVSTGEGFSGAAGLPGVGIYRSTDGGESFQLLPATQNSQFYWVNKIVVDPHDQNHLYAVVLDADRDHGAHNEGGILKESLDDGDSWKNVYTSNTRLTDIEIHPTNGNVRIVAGHGTVKVWSGSSWVEKVTNVLRDGSLPHYPGRVEIALSSDYNIVYALMNYKDSLGTAGVYRSDDGGINWEFQGGRSDIFSGSSSGNYANTIMVDPLNVNIIYLGGLDMWKSIDKGNTFTRISDWHDHYLFTNQGDLTDIQLHIDQHIMVPSLLYSNNNKKVYIGNDGGVQKADDISIASTDMVSGWDNLTGNMCTVQFYGGTVSPNGMFAGGAQDNGILIKDNNNYNITNDWTHPQRGDGANVYFRTEDSIYATVNYNQLRRSIDGGKDFEVIFDLSTVDESLLIGPSAYDERRPAKVYLGGTKLWLYDDDSGVSTMIKDTVEDNRLISSIYVNSDFLIIGYTHGELEYSRDGGMTWSGDITSLSGLNVPNKYITDIHPYFIGKTSSGFIITFGGYRSNNVWKMTLIGPVPAFTQISLGFDMQVNTATTHPQNSNWLYLGTDVGIMASEDRGETWSIIPLMPNYDPIYSNDSPFYAEVQELFWDYVESQGVYHLCAATYGRGIIRSDYVLHESCVDLTSGGVQYGTRARPYDNFSSALDVAEDKGTPVLFLESGEYKNDGQLWNKRVLIKSEANAGAVIREY